MKILLFSLLFSLFACSNLSKTIVSKGTFTLSEGKSAQKSWSDDLSFKRVSWFKELTLYFDFFYAELDQSSQFAHWLSESEKDIFKKCPVVYVALVYEKNSDLLSKNDLFSQLKSFQVEKYTLNHFSRQLRMHPNYQKNSLTLHKFYGLCANEKLDSKEIFFPGFKKVSL